MSAVGVRDAIEPAALRARAKESRPPLTDLLGGKLFALAGFLVEGDVMVTCVLLAVHRSPHAFDRDPVPTFGAVWAP